MKPLLILDIDETLLHTETFPGKDYLEPFQYDFSFPGDEEGKNYYYVLKRPFLDEFLEYAFENFEVGVWTAASPDYAEIILDNIGILDKLKFLYTKDNCTLKIDYDHKYNSGQYYGVKNLSKLRKKGYSLSKVLIVDDVRATAENNYGNLIHIKTFYNDKNETELLKLISYLEKIKDEPNYRNIDKRTWSQGK